MSNRHMAILNQSELENAPGVHQLETAWGTTMILDVRNDRDSTPIVEGVLASLAKADKSEVLTLNDELFLSTDGAFDPFDGQSPTTARSRPGGLFQAWAVSKVTEMLRAKGCENYSVTSGGHFTMAGRRSPSKPWRVGIRNPVAAGSLTTAIASGKDELAIATSHPFHGTSEVIDSSSDGHHSELAGVTVVGPNIAIAHAFAAALFIKGIEGLDWITGFTGYDAHVVTHHNAAHWTPGFKQHWTV